ncbi:MAG: hypothetical protein HYX74_00415 [Acidobacteria bacterium]|nr:hypothetical protein [Acidobacteriota bacterium]
MDSDAKSKRRKFLREYLRIFPATTALLLAALTILPVQAQEKTSVALTAQQVMPGNQAYVTVMLINNPAVDVSQLQQWIEFPKDRLSYVSARMSIAGDLAEAELKVEVTDKSGTGSPEGAESKDTPEAGGESAETAPQAPEAPAKEPGEPPAETAAAEVPEMPGQEAAPQTGNIGVIHLTIIGKRPIPDGPVAEITSRSPRQRRNRSSACFTGQRPRPPTARRCQSLQPRTGS